MKGIFKKIFLLLTHVYDMYVLESRESQIFQYLATKTASTAMLILATEVRSLLL
jgi:hypothetical protein